MRVMKVAVLLLLFTCSCLGQSIEDRVKTFEDAKKSYSVKYDKFQKLTNVEVTIKVPSKKGTLFLYSHLILHDDGEYSVVMLVEGGAYNFHIRPVMRFLLNGKLLELQSDDVEKLPGFIISSDSFTRIATADKIEIQLGTFEGQCDSKAIAIFKNLYSLTRPLPQS